MCHTVAPPSDFKRHTKPCRYPEWERVSFFGETRLTPTPSPYQCLVVTVNNGHIRVPFVPLGVTHIETCTVFLFFFIAVVVLTKETREGLCCCL